MGKSSGLIQLGPKSNDGYPFKKRRGHRHIQRHRESGLHEVEGMLPPANQCQEPPEAKGDNEGFPPRGFGGNMFPQET